jgi:hypothetical protein
MGPARVQDPTTSHRHGIVFVDDGDSTLRPLNR